jgi:hypothetical protein
MSEPRETANADVDQAIPCFAGDIAAGRGQETRSFSQKNSRCEFFCEKEKSVPCCRRRVGLATGQTPGLHIHRVTAVNYMSYAVVSADAPIRRQQRSI